MELNIRAIIVIVGILIISATSKPRRLWLGHTIASDKHNSFVTYAKPIEAPDSVIAARIFIKWLRTQGYRPRSFTRGDWRLFEITDNTTLRQIKE